MDEEYQFIDAAGWTYTTEDMDRILQTALDNNEIPVNTSYEDWLKSEGFKVGKIEKQKEKAFKHITQEAFDNVPEGQLVPILQSMYGKKIDISQAKIGTDAIKIKDKTSTIWDTINLNTAHNAFFVGEGDRDTDAYEKFINLLDLTDDKSSYYTDPALDPEAVKLRKSWLEDKQIEKGLVDYKQIDINMPIYSTETSEQPTHGAVGARGTGAIVQTGTAIAPTPLELTKSERLRTLDDIQSIVETAWTKILEDPSSYNLSDEDRNRLSDRENLDISHKDKLYYQNVVFEEVNNLLAAEGIQISKDDFINNFSQASPTYSAAELNKDRNIERKNLQATADANVASVTPAYLDNITNAEKANYINIRPESAPRIKNIESLREISSDMGELKNKIEKLEQDALDGDGKEGDQETIARTRTQHNDLLIKFKKIQNSMEDPVLYDYTRNRPADATDDENTWRRKQQAVQLIENEIGVPLSELDNLENYYNNLKKQRVIRQEDATKQMITVDLDKFMVGHLRRELLTRRFINTLGQKGEIKMSLFDYTSVNLSNPNWNQYEGWDAEALEEGIFFGPETPVIGYGHILPGLDTDEIRTVLAYNEFLLNNQDKSEILFERIYVQPDLQKMEDNIGFWETLTDTAEQSGFMGMLKTSQRESGRTNFFTRDGLLGGRVRLDMYKEIVDEINYVMEDSGASPIEFTPRELEALTVDAWNEGLESWGTVVGGFVPIAADLLVSAALVETGIGATVGLANIAKAANRFKWFWQSIDKVKNLSQASTGMDKVLWYTTKGLKMEAETKLAGFDWGSGATFSTLGLATRNIKLISALFPQSAVMIDKGIKASLTGVVSVEAAGITEASIRVARGQEGFNQWWHTQYGSFDEVIQRVIQNAVLFGLYGNMKPIGKAISGDPAARSLFRSSQNNANARLAINKEIEKLELLKEKDPNDTTIQDRIEVLKQTSATIGMMELNKMGGWKAVTGLRENAQGKKDKKGNIIMEVDPSFIVESQKKIDILTKKLGGPPITVKYNPKMKDKGGYTFEGNLLEINPKAKNFGSGVIPHEVLVHYAIRSRLEQGGKEVFAKWTNQLKEGINKIFKETDFDFGKLTQKIKEKYGKKNADGKWEMNEGLKNEEALAFFVEMMADPGIYFSTVGKGLMKNVKNQWLSLLENTGLKTYDIENIKEMSNVQALEIMARLVNDMQFGKSGGTKIMISANLDKLKDPFYTTREGVRRQEGELALKGKQKLQSKEIDLDISKENKLIAKENKRIEDLIMAEGVWKIGEIENKALAEELKNALIQNNSGLVNKLANQAFNNPNIAGLEAGLKIPLKDWQQGYKQQLIEMINTYEPIPQDGSSKGKQVPFGAYIAQNLHRRYGNILNIEKGKLPEMAGRIEGDIIAEESIPEVAGDLVLAKELKIDNKVISEFEKTLLEEIKDLETLDQLTYKEFRAKWPKGVVGDIFGTTRVEREQTFRDKAKEIMASWPETNQTRGGESLGVGTALLNFMYGKAGRTKMSEGAGGAGLPERIKQEKTPQELIDFLFGKNVGYTTSQARIKSAINLTMRGLATQLISDPTKTKMKEAIQDFSIQDIKVKEAISNLEQVFTKEFDRIDTARERGETLELRESDINQAMKRVDKAMDQYTNETRARIREGLAPELASKDIGILKDYWEDLRLLRPRSVNELKTIIGKDNWDQLTTTSQGLLTLLTKAYNGYLKALDAIYYKHEASKLGISETVYKKEYKDQIQGFSEKDGLSKELGTKDKTIPSLRIDDGARTFAKNVLKRFPNFDNLSSHMQQKVMSTFGFGDHGGGFITNGKGFTFEGQNIKIGQYSKLLTKVFGEGWKSKKYVTNHWKTSFSSSKQWGGPLNTAVAEILKSNKLDSVKYQKLETLFKQEGIDFDSTVKANLKVLADVYKALEGAAKDMVREGKDVTEALQAVQDFLKPQTNRARGLLKTIVPVLFIETAPKKGIDKYKKKVENYYTEHMRELFNANKTFIRDLKRSLDGEFSQEKFDTRLTKNINDLMQGLVGARTSEIKDAKGPSYQWYYNPILSITMGGRKTWDTTISLGGNNIYNSTTLADMIFNTATRQVRRLIEGTANSELTIIGVLVKQHIKNKTQAEAARIRNIKINRAAKTLYSKDLSNGEYLGSLKNRDKALELAREKDKKTKGISVFDFDDTLAKTKSKVIVNAPYYGPGKMQETTMRITAAEFAKRHAELEKAGAAFDFSEFNKVLGGKKGPLFDLAVKRQGKFGSGDIYILSARPQEAALAIKAFLKGLGLDIPLENIVGLESGSPIAKSDWVLSKAAEGYNDFYFADDARPNVKAVQDVLNVIDVKSKVQQALMSKNLGESFNKVIEESFGIERFKDYKQTKARILGVKHKESWWLPASASDLPLMMDRIAGKGKQGDAHQKLFNDVLYEPYARGERNLTETTLSIYRDFKGLQTQLKGVTSQLKNKVGDYTIEQAIRVRNWTALGIEIPGLNKKDAKLLNDKVNKDSELSAFAEQIISIQKGQYAKPAKYWEAGGLFMDINNTLKTNLRQEYLKEWQENVNAIFTPEFYNKLEAVQGPKFVESLKQMLSRMRRGSNRSGNESRLETKMLNFLNNATASIMFLNTRTAVLQTISSFNYINWTDNNPFKAAARFANLPQYIKDWSRLMNSDWAIARRKGLRINIQEAELVESLTEAQDKGQALLGWLLKEGFILTKMGDTFATATGGATFYRNRINTYKKQNLSDKAAEKQAYQDWVELSEENQQSARMDRISMQQATPLGRVVLAFANTPMQYARLQKRAYMNLVNRRGDAKTNISKIVYYAFVQNLMFNALQNALFTELYNDPGVSDDKTIRIGNGMVDGILRGGGITGSGIAMLKNVALKLYNEDKKKRPKYSNAAWEVLGISPPLKSKIGKVRSGFAALEYNMKDIKSMGFNFDNPAYLASGQLVSGFTNFPLDRMIIKLQNIQEAMNEELQWYERMALLGGWKDWELGIKDSETAKYFGEEFDLKKREKEIIKQTNSDWLFKTGNP